MIMQLLAAEKARLAVGCFEVGQVSMAMSKVQRNAMRLDRNGTKPLIHASIAACVQHVLH